MLQRTPDSRKPKRKRRPSRKRKAKLQRARQARYWRRQRDGLTWATVTIDAVVLDWMVRRYWITPAEADADDKAAIGAAISKMLAGAAKAELL